MHVLTADERESPTEVEMPQDQHKPRTEDWSPAHPRISVAGWITAITLAVAGGVVMMGLLGAAIHGNGSPSLG